jgi:hypothetical protein
LNFLRALAFTAFAPVADRWLKRDIRSLIRRQNCSPDWLTLPNAARRQSGDGRDPWICFLPVARARCVTARGDAVDVIEKRLLSVAVTVQSATLRMRTGQQTETPPEADAKRFPAAYDLRGF